MKEFNLKDIYFDINETNGVNDKIAGDVPEIGKSVDTLLNAIPDDDTRNALDIEIGRYCVASEYKGFLLGIIAASQNHKLLKLLEDLT